MENAQTLSSQMRINVQLLVDLRPQLIADSPPTSSARVHGRNFARDLVVSLQKSFSCIGEDIVGGRPFGIEEVVPILQSLSGTSLEIMPLLEDAQLPDTSESGSDKHTQDAHRISDRLATYVGGSGGPDIERRMALCCPPADATQLNGTNDAVNAHGAFNGTITAGDAHGGPSTELLQPVADVSTVASEASGSKGLSRKGSDAKGKAVGTRERVQRRNQKPPSQKRSVANE